MLGRRFLDLAGGSGDWTDATGYGAGEPAFVVVTSSLPESVRLTDLDWTFVTTGLPDAVAAARERAEAASADRGADLDVVLMGGGAVIGSAVDAGWWTLRRCTSRPSCWEPGRRCPPAARPARSCRAA